MAQVQKPKYDLEERTLQFALSCRNAVLRNRKDMASWEYERQLIRYSGSVGANYIEANESLGKKDLRMWVKICRKEAKESQYWLRLLSPVDQTLLQEARELTHIFGAILTKL